VDVAMGAFLGNDPNACGHSIVCLFQSSPLGGVELVAELQQGAGVVGDLGGGHEAELVLHPRQGPVPPRRRTPRQPPLCKKEGATFPFLLWWVNPEAPSSLDTNTMTPRSKKFTFFCCQFLITWIAPPSLLITRRVLSGVWVMGRDSEATGCPP